MEQFRRSAAVASGLPRGLVLAAPRLPRISLASEPRREEAFLHTLDWVRAKPNLWLPSDSLRFVPLPVETMPTNGGNRVLEESLADLDRIGARDLTDAAKLDALERTIDRIRWYPRSATVRRALRERIMAGEVVEQVKRRELRAAVFLVLAGRHHPQFHRFGRSWPTNAGGRRQPIVPAELAPEQFWAWFVDECRRVAEAAVLGRPCPGTGLDVLARPERAILLTTSGSAVFGGGFPPRPHSDAPPLNTLDHLPSPDPDPLQQVVDRESSVDIQRQWQAVLDAATPGQRELLQVLRAEIDNSDEASLAAAAQQLRIAPSTARVQWKRLLERIRSRRPSSS